VTKRADAPDEQVIEHLAGAALILDEQLRILTATPSARSVLGFDIPQGTSAAMLLCGDRPKRPFAEALARGEAFRAVIPRPHSTTKDQIRVRAVPIGDGAGWIVYLFAIGDGDHEPVLFHGMWTQDPRMKETFRIIGKVAAEEVSVLVRGETGAGKELVAHALHALSPRSAGPFRALNCGGAAREPARERAVRARAGSVHRGRSRTLPATCKPPMAARCSSTRWPSYRSSSRPSCLRVLETHTVLPVVCPRADPRRRPRDLRDSPRVAPGGRGRGGSAPI
jgi:transcriptional regulator of acetoin/glycerol metabolism